jgi:hypothetical protein
VTVPAPLWAPGGATPAPAPVVGADGAALHHLTLATKPSPGMELMLASSAALGWPTRVLGGGNMTIALGHAGVGGPAQWGLRLRVLHDAAAALPPRDWVLWTDAYDVIFQRHAGSFLRALEGWEAGAAPSGTKLLFAGELGEWPDGDQPYTSRHRRFPFLNAGTWAGRAGDVAAATASGYAPDTDDQRFFTGQLLRGEGPTPGALGVDHDGLFFGSMGILPEHRIGYGTRPRGTGAPVYVGGALVADEDGLPPLDARHYQGDVLGGAVQVATAVGAAAAAAAVAAARSGGAAVTTTRGPAAPVVTLPGGGTPWMVHFNGGTKPTWWRVARYLYGPYGAARAEPVGWTPATAARWRWWQVQRFVLTWLLPQRVGWLVNDDVVTALIVVALAVAAGAACGGAAWRARPKWLLPGGLPLVAGLAGGGGGGGAAAYAPVAAGGGDAASGGGGVLSDGDDED